MTARRAEDVAEGADVTEDDTRGPDFAPPDPADRPSRTGARRAATPRRTPRWAGVLAILLALMVIGTVTRFLPDGDPRTVTRAGIGDWAEVDDYRIRVLDVQVSERMLGTLDEFVTVPGSTFVVVTIEAEALEEEGMVSTMVELVSGGKTYEPLSDMGMYPDAGPGFISHGQVGFVVPNHRASKGNVEFSESFGLLTGIVRDTVRVGYQDPTSVPFVASSEGQVRVA